MMMICCCCSAAAAADDDDDDAVCLPLLVHFITLACVTVCLEESKLFEGLDSLVCGGWTSPNKVSPA